MTDDARGQLLVSKVPLSFWGGVNPDSGVVVDEHHPLKGENLVGRVVAIPSGRGSCSGSGALLELILNDRAPAALLFIESEEILLLGALIGAMMFGKSMPVLRVDQSVFDQLCSGDEVSIRHNEVVLMNAEGLQTFSAVRLDQSSKAGSAYDSADTSDASQQCDSALLKLTPRDREFLAGLHGKAAEVAMRIVLRMAVIQGAAELIPVTQAHIDGCIYHGPSSLQFAQQLVEWGAQVQVPTTLNALSVDQRRWQKQGVDPEVGEPASLLGDAYMAMGSQLSYTCAPYLLDTAPTFGEQIVWAESNAVAYANSVLGARTQKYPDFLDICIALTGRAPGAGAHLEQWRKPTVCVSMLPIVEPDDAFWPLLGYHVGLIASNDIPLVLGLEDLPATTDDLKAFSAAFATSSSMAMFHIAGHTPEAQWAAQSVAQPTADVDTEVSVVSVSLRDLLSSWRELNTADCEHVDMICLGNPHFSLTECQSLAALCIGREKDAQVDVIVTVGREIMAQAAHAGAIEELRKFGVQFINDTCWCMLQEPVIPKVGSTLMTNSGKYAHYGPGLVDRRMHFGSLAECVDAACSGKRRMRLPKWLQTP